MCLKFMPFSWGSMNSKITACIWTIIKQKKSRLIELVNFSFFTSLLLSLKCNFLKPGILKQLLKRGKFSLL